MQVPARRFEWNDLFINPTGKFHTGDSYEIPCPMDIMIQLVRNMLIYWIMTWYFDHIMPNNRGRTHEYLFFLKISYWFGKKKKVVAELPLKGRGRRVSSVDQYDNQSKESTFRDTVLDEKHQIMDDERDNIH